MSFGGEHWIHTVLGWLQQSEQTELRESALSAIREASALDLDSLCDVLEGQREHLANSPEATRLLMQMVAARVVELTTESEENEPEVIRAETLASLYETVVELDELAAAHVLQMLSRQTDPDSIETLARLLVDSPPESWQSVGLAVSSLWHAGSEQLQVFFEHVSDGFVHPTTMAVLLDLANYSVRSTKLDKHPWAERSDTLGSLLESVIHRLKELEQAPAKFGDSVEAVQKTLGDSVSLTVSLCDALGLIESPESMPVLKQALALSHRRIQTEAAGALAKLGEQAGREHVIKLAEDRAARLRAIAYADELGFSEHIDESLRLPHALAESELAIWLAAPEQFGLPPTEMELIDSRTQYWPSYDEPQDCFLFRYNYPLPSGGVSNVGIAGPLTHAFASDLANLPVDDIYAAFAGWQAEHEDIFEVPSGDWNPAQIREAEVLTNTFGERDLTVESPIALTFFLGEVALLAIVEQDGKRLAAITDGQELLYLPVGTSQTALTPETVLCIYRGRKLLRTFNPQG